MSYRVSFWRRLAYLFTGRVETLRLPKIPLCSSGWKHSLLPLRNVVHNDRGGTSVVQVGPCVYCGVEQRGAPMRAEVVS